MLILYRNIFILFLLYITISSITFISFTTDPGIQTDARTTFEKQLTGTADRPFVFRFLPAFLIRHLVQQIPPSAWKLFHRYSWERTIQTQLEQARIERPYEKEWFVFKFLSLACLMGFGGCLYHLQRFYYPEIGSTAHLWALLGVAFLPVFFGPLNQIYDPFSLVLPALAYWSLLFPSFVGFYGAFVLATMNKELSFLLIFFFWVLLRHRLSSKSMRRHLGIQILIWSSVTFWIHTHFTNTPGASLEFHFFDNLHFLITPSLLLLTWIVKMTVFGFLVISGWRQKDKDLRLAFLGAFFVTELLMLFFGRLSEIRNGYEWLFILYLLMVPALEKILRQQAVESQKI